MKLSKGSLLILTLDLLQSDIILYVSFLNINCKEVITVRRKEEIGNSEINNMTLTIETIGFNIIFQFPSRLKKLYSD